VIVTAGQVVPLQSTLERVSTVLTVVSSPPDVEVFVNGVSRGKTGSGPVPASLAGVPAQLGVPASLVSQPLIIGDIPAGTLQVDLRRPCYATEHRQLPVEGMSDVMLDPVKLAGRAPWRWTASRPGRPCGSTGSRRARADHDGLGVRGAHDRVPRRVGPRRRARDPPTRARKLSVKGRVRPAFALLAAPVTGGTPDPRLPSSARSPRPPTSWL
jgi:hypothetical protein